MLHAQEHNNFIDNGWSTSAPKLASGSNVQTLIKNQGLECELELSVVRFDLILGFLFSCSTLADEDSAKEIPSLAVSTRSVVSMRDMGTAMTPTASVDPSRTATPIRATTPEKSPTSSHSATPERNFSADAVKSNHMEAAGTPTTGNDHVQSKARQEILALGEHLGRANITARAAKEDQNNTNVSKISSKDCTAVDLEQLRKNVLTTRVAAWEEAEKAKYTSRSGTSTLICAIRS